MAYIYDLVTTTFVAAASVEVPLPDHDEGDLLLLCCSQDNGATTIAASGWSDVAAQAVNGACRQAWLMKVAGASEANPNVTGTTDEWVVTAIAIKDFDAVTPIDVALRADWSGSTGDAPSVNTTTDRCLILRSWISDSPVGDEKIIVPMANLLEDTKQINELVHLIGHEVKEIAGTTGAKTAYSEVSVEGGNAWTIAIRNAAGGDVAPYIINGPERIGFYGKYGTQHDGFTWTALSNAAPTIGGITVSTNVATISDNPTTSIASMVDTWGYQTSIADAQNLGVASFVGASHGVSLDLSGKTVSISWGWFNNTTSPSGPEGVIVVFRDGSGNWVAYRLLPLLSMAVQTQYVSTISVGNAVEYDSSGTMNWANVVQVGYGFHRLAGYTNSRNILIGRTAIHNPAVTVVGGGSETPASVTTVAKAMRSYGLQYASSDQGEGQSLLTAGFQIGNGTLPTYFSALGSAQEFALPYSTRRKRFAWNVGEGALAITVYASPNDVISLASSILRTASKQKFEIHTSSSTLATYNFAGAVIYGYEVTWRDGITCNDAGFVGCHKITANGGTFDGCMIDGCLDPIALTTDDPSKITDCMFVQGLAGHAIEITTPGTYTFSGNMFADYGADGTTDAAIYNNSGGLVTLNISGGGDTPTVRNGAGSSTTLVSGATITVTNLVTGSRVLVTRDDTSAVLFNDVETAGSISFSTSYVGGFTVVARRASTSPYYREWFGQGTTVSGETSAFKAQQQLDE